MPVTLPDVVVVTGVLTLTGGTGTAGVGAGALGGEEELVPELVPLPDVVVRPGDTRWLSGPPVTTMLVVCVVPEVLAGGAVVTGFAVTGAVGVGLVVTGTGTGIGGTGRFFVVVGGGVVIWPEPDDEVSPVDPVPDDPVPDDPVPDWVSDGSEPFVLLSPGVTVWLSGVDTGVSCPFTWPDVSPVPPVVVFGAGGVLCCCGAGWDGCSVGAGSLDAGVEGAVEGVVGDCPSTAVVVPSGTAGRPSGVVTGSPSERYRPAEYRGGDHPERDRSAGSRPVQDVYPCRRPDHRRHPAGVHRR